MTEGKDLIDNVWSKTEDNEWVVYKSDLMKWRAEKGFDAPPCPVCGDRKAGIINIRQEENIKRGNCRACGAKLAIIENR